MLQKLIYSIFVIISSNFSNFYVLFIFLISFGRTCYGTTVVSESWCQSDQGTGSRLPKLPTSTADAVTRSPCGQRWSRCSFLAPSLRPPPKRGPAQATNSLTNWHYKYFHHELNLISTPQLRDRREHRKYNPPSPLQSY